MMRCLRAGFLVVSAVLASAAAAQRRVTSPSAATHHLERLGCEVVATDYGVTELRHACGATVSVRRGAVPAGVADHPLLLVVGNIAATRRTLHQRSVPFDELVAAPSGAVSLRARDPDGYVTILRQKDDAADRSAVPKLGELNPIVLELLARYPTDGTHRYYWPKDGSWKGCTKDLVYRGELLARGDDEHRCYCCGLTFEVFFDAWLLWCRRNARDPSIADLDLAAVRRLQRQWFGSPSDKSCLHTALVSNGLGVRIRQLEDARPGDFVQLWRESGSGHSVVFLDWVRKDHRIAGLRYWSTQPATKGIGERVEWFDARAGRKRVLRDPLWICRPGH